MQFNTLYYPPPPPLPLPPSPLPFSPSPLPPPDDSPGELAWWHSVLIGAGILITVLAVIAVGLLLVSPQTILVLEIHVHVPQKGFVWGAVFLWIMCAVYCVQVMMLLIRNSQFRHRKLQETSDTLSFEVQYVNMYVQCIHVWLMCIIHA